MSASPAPFWFFSGGCGVGAPQALPESKRPEPWPGAATRGGLLAGAADGSCTPWDVSSETCPLAAVRPGSIVNGTADETEKSLQCQVLATQDRTPGVGTHSLSGV